MLDSNKKHERPTNTAWTNGIKPTNINTANKVWQLTNAAKMTMITQVKYEFLRSHLFKLDCFDYVTE